ncbi:hypothetical protein ABE01_14780 [Bacillus paralicheniformis]|jgi:hypothetical protein|nr:hypothetical protein ACJ43_00595 [Bacillus paralicheniformis]KRT87769.1 hypothetical protein ACH97_210660 [Bacillus paralicheniformis]MBG9883561.1 hypothetical protein [Bacillus paralicheniformis]
MFKKLVINRKVGLFMLNFTWNVFSQTGSVDTYLLFKELEKENLERPEVLEEELAQIDFPIL